MQSREVIGQGSERGSIRWSIATPLIVLAILAVFALLVHGDYRVATTLGLVQGLGEFLPISSSAHLIITPWLLGWTGPPYAFLTSQTFDVALHMGTLVALILVFWRDWLGLILHAGRPRTTEGRLFWLLVIASVPGAIFGAALDTYAEGYFSDKYLVVAAMLAIMGVVLYVADQRGAERSTMDDLTWRDALWIGLSQALALIPGVSRSGATMSMGRALGLRRESAARFSFLMATPITFGAGVLKLRKLPIAEVTPPFWLGIAVAAIAGVAAITVLLRFLQRRGNSFLPFAVYRVGLAAVIVIVYLLRHR